MTIRGRHVRSAGAGVAALSAAAALGVPFAMSVALGGLAMAGVAARGRRLAFPALAWAMGAWAVCLPLTLQAGSAVLDDAILALAYTVMALGLNVIVGLAGLLDLGYVAFFAIGALVAGWLGSSFFATAGGGHGVHVVVPAAVEALPGIHLNFLLIVVAAVFATTLAGVVIGIPTLRLRGDYIAIVTLAFGEIAGRIALNGDQIKVFGSPLTAGRQGITPIDAVALPGLSPFTQLDLRPWYWTALALVVIGAFVSNSIKDSRIGRAWIAIREDEIAAVSEGVPLVRTKLAAYGTGAAFGGVSGAFLASYLNTVNADQFQFSFSIFILAMVVLGGMGSVWGAMFGAITLTIINNRVIPDVLNGLPGSLGLDFDLTQLSYGIFGGLLTLVMLSRPEGLFPDRQHKVEYHEQTGVATSDASGMGP